MDERTAQDDQWIHVGNGAAMFSKSSLTWENESGIRVVARQVIETAPNGARYMRLATAIEDELLDRLIQAGGK